MSLALLPIPALIGSGDEHEVKGFCKFCSCLFDFSSFPSHLPLTLHGDRDTFAGVDLLLREDDLVRGGRLLRVGVMLRDHVAAGTVRCTGREAKGRGGTQGHGQQNAGETVSHRGVVVIAVNN